MRIRTVGVLDPEEIAGVCRTIDEATAADDSCPVSEETLLHLRVAGHNHGVLHVLAEADSRIVGYGVLIQDESRHGRLAELAVAPDYRSRGIGHAIIERLLDLVAGQGLALWAHGRDAHAAPLARAMHFDRQRTLLQMRRSLTRRLPQTRLPAGFTIRAFRPGVDDAAFLQANAAAFSHLPDQGGWTQSDLDKRFAQSWFKPSDVLLLEAPDGQLAGFHWTKPHPPEPLGEIYVLAIVPAFQGRGLAGPLAVVGLRQLRSRGATTAMLYVDEANDRAVALYRTLGFAEWDVDVLYARGPSSGP